MEASRRLAHKAVSLNAEVSQREGSSIRELLKAHLDESADQLKASEAQLLAYKRTAQVELLERDTDAMMDERGELLRLTIDIESEKARLSAAESEITKQPRLLSVGRSVSSEEALRRAAELDKNNPSNAAITDAQTLDLSNPFINPVYQTLALQIATSRAQLAALQQHRRELIEVKKLGGHELKELGDLYSRQIELARLREQPRSGEQRWTVISACATKRPEARELAAARCCRLSMMRFRPIGRCRGKVRNRRHWDWSRD